VHAFFRHTSTDAVIAQILIITFWLEICHHSWFSSASSSRAVFFFCFYVLSSCIWLAWQHYSSHRLWRVISLWSPLRLMKGEGPIRRSDPFPHSRKPAKVVWTAWSPKNELHGSYSLQRRIYFENCDWWIWLGASMTQK
jgi:hypothetical protein